MLISQHKYAIEILERANMLTCNLSQTPLDTESKLAVDGDLISHPTILYSSSTSSLVAYSDVDWAGCPTTRRSTCGYCVFPSNKLCLLVLQAPVYAFWSGACYEVEYRDVVNVVVETCWLGNL
ncbi:ribonuclease H-like domain-containing protein [Tanacetum coccineum]